VVKTLGDPSQADSELPRRGRPGVSRRTEKPHVERSELPALAHFPVAIRLQVQWGDQDAFQHVNNIVYFRWFETVRIVYLETIGLQAMMETEHIGPILAAISCQYRSPVTYPDVVHLGTRVTRLGRSSIAMDHQIYSQAQQALVAEGESTLVVFDYQQQKSRPIPAEIRRAIEQCEGKEFPPT
jgi:acyl-CoA thioester hydrolase